MSTLDRLAACERVVGVVAQLGGEVEGGRQARLPLARFRQCGVRSRPLLTNALVTPRAVAGGRRSPSRLR